MSVFLPPKEQLELVPKQVSKVPVGSGLVQRQPGPVHHTRPQVPDPKHRASLRHHPSQGEAATGSAGAGGWENTHIKPANIGPQRTITKYRFQQGRKSRGNKKDGDNLRL